MIFTVTKVKASKVLLLGIKSLFNCNIHTSLTTLTAMIPSHNLNFLLYLMALYVGIFIVTTHLDMTGILTNLN